MKRQRRYDDYQKTQYNQGYQDGLNNRPFRFCTERKRINKRTKSGTGYVSWWPSYNAGYEQGVSDREKKPEITLPFTTIFLVSRFHHRYYANLVERI